MPPLATPRYSLQATSNIAPHRRGALTSTAKHLTFADKPEKVALRRPPSEEGPRAALDREDGGREGTARSSGVDMKPRGWLPRKGICPPGCHICSLPPISGFLTLGNAMGHELAESAGEQLAGSER
jgi:hypothetical protein